MKVYRPLAEAVVHSLQIIFRENRKADKVIREVLKSNKKWGSKDRAFIAENTYDIVRWWRLLHNINQTKMDRTDTHIMWRLLAIWLRIKDVELPHFEEFVGVSRKMVKEGLENAAEVRKIVESIPDWLDDLGFEELGEVWSREIAAMNRQAPVALRVNTEKATLEELRRQLKEDGFETSNVKGVPSALELHKRGNVFGSKAFRKGMFEVQDPGSQCIAAYLDVKEGMRVIDACAGAGGKALHLSNIMNNKGVIIALDTEGWKLTELKKRARRNSAHNIETRPITGKVIKRLRGSADRLLLDVPCSGLGTLRRNPDAKWKLSAEFLDRVRNTQAEILQDYSKMLKPGGKMVYATCSILPSENQDQVVKFLKNNPEFSLIKEESISTAETGFDGFYMALIQKSQQEKVEPIKNKIMTPIPLNPKQFITKIGDKTTALYQLKNDEIEVNFTNYGARMVSCIVDGKDVVLGFDSVDKYINAGEKYHGAAIGRFGNRIAKATFELEGNRYNLNANNDENSLHGGPNGFHNKVWDLVSHSSDRLELKLHSPDMEEGFPGNLDVTLIYTLSGREIKIEYHASSDKTTVINLTHHNYFNLNGEGQGSVMGHEVKIEADHYTPIDESSIPTGEIASVENTKFDFRNFRKLADVYAPQGGELPDDSGADHNFVLRKVDDEIRLAGSAKSPSGLLLEVYTNEPGLQFYTGNWLNGKDIGKSDKVYKKWSGLCMEQQHFPDSPNQPNFPSTTLSPDEKYYSVCIHKYSK